MFFCLFAFLVPFQLASQEAGISDLASVAGKAMTQKRHQAYLVSAQAQLKGPIWTNVPLKLQESAHRCSVSLGHWTKGTQVFLSVGGCQLSLALWGDSPWQLLSISLPMALQQGSEGLLMQFQSLHYGWSLHQCSGKLKQVQLNLSSLCIF